jgi:MoxR-like ATPase
MPWTIDPAKRSEDSTFDKNKDTDWCSAKASKEILGGVTDPVPDRWHGLCLERLIQMRNQLRDDYFGMNDVIDIVLSCVIARENVLLLGPPGNAKSELATRVFQLLGLEQAKVNEATLAEWTGAKEVAYADWVNREDQERMQQKYFHYLLSRFTQPEELFGPIDLSHLRKGLLVRVNFGMLTGPGVRGGFIDETFKGSSNILNGLLTLSGERKYFNWGEMRSADLAILIGASNEMPGGFGSGHYGVGVGQDDFQTLHAFVDRFPARLIVDVPSATDKPAVEDSGLAQAFQMAIKRETVRFRTGAPSGFGRPAGMPCINDVLCLGRAMMEDFEEQRGFFGTQDQRGTFRERFLGLARSLRSGGTKAETQAVTWTISARKLRALWKLALAHSLVRAAGGAVRLLPEHLCVFYSIWDTPAAVGELKIRVDNYL